MPKPEDKTILVVDDEEDAREYLATVLEDAGFNVVLAVDGDDALDKVRSAPPDFISLDLVMPGKSGIRFLHELRRNKEWEKIPFVIVTAHASDEQGQDDLQNIMAGKTFSGPGFYLEKPVKPEEYIKFVCEQVGVDYAVPQEADRAEALREELQQMLRGADTAQMERAVRALSKPKKH